MTGLPSSIVSSTTASSAESSPPHANKCLASPSLSQTHLTGAPSLFSTLLKPTSPTLSHNTSQMLLNAPTYSHHTLLHIAKTDPVLTSLNPMLPPLKTSLNMAVNTLPNSMKTLRNSLTDLPWKPNASLSSHTTALNLDMSSSLLNAFATIGSSLSQALAPFSPLIHVESNKALLSPAPLPTS